MLESLHIKKPLYPLVCIISSLSLLIAGLFQVKSRFFPIWLLAILVLYVIFGYGKSALKCIVIFIPVSVIMAGSSYLFSRDMMIALQMGQRVLLLGLSSVPMVTLPPVQLTRCLTQLKVPRVLSLGLLIAIRFIPILGAEVKQIREAMKTRGVRVTWYNPSWVYRALMVPLLMRVINITETLSLSLETRGFELEYKEATIYQSVDFQMRDILYSVCLLMVVIGMGVLK